MFHRLVAVILATFVLAPAARSQQEAAPATDPAREAAEVRAALREQQRHLAALAKNSGPDSDREILALLDQYRAGMLPAALWLELFEAAAGSTDPAVQARLAEHNQTLEQSRDLVKRFRDCLEGGDAEAGRVIFTTRPEAGCVRCHRVSGEGGQIGPELTALQQATDRVFILESIVDPNTTIASGFQHMLLKLKSGESVSGIVSFESGEVVGVTSIIDGKRRDLPTRDIIERTPLPSAMPPGFGTILGKHAVRDLVEFIATVK